MKIKTMQKVLSIILLTMMIVSTISTVVMAATTPGNITASNDITTDAIDKAGGKLLGVVQAIGVVLSVVVLAAIGVKYMMGSVEEKAEYKKTLMPYVVGAGLIFTASFFAQAIFEFFSGWGD